MNTFVEETSTRFRKIADVMYDGNKSELARALDMQPSSFAKYTQGQRKPGATVLQRLSKLGVNVNWFLTGNGPMIGSSASMGNSTEHGQPVTSDAPAFSEADFQRVPLVQARVDRAGNLHLDEVGEPEWISCRFIRRQYDVAPRHLRSFRLSCNFMAPTIRPGAQVRGRFYEESPELGELNEGAPYHMLGPSGVYTMRIFVKGEKVVLKGDNPEINDETIALGRWKQAFRPIARLFHVIHHV